MMEEKQSAKTPEAPTPPGKKGSKVGCRKVLLWFFLGSVLLFFLAAFGVALAVAATGLVDIPVLSSIIKPPAVTEDFSYKKVSEKQLNKKLESSLSGTEGKVKITITLTDDEVNSLVADLASTPDSPVKSILVKFRSGVIKISGVLSENDAPFYAEIQIAKSANKFEFGFQHVRLGALPIPEFIIQGLISQLLGTGQLTAESLPVKSITVKDGSITIKGLDLSGLSGSK